MKSSRLWLIGAVAGLLTAAAACGDNKVKPDAQMVDAEEEFDYLARGTYIVNTLGACAFCHTPLLADGTRDMTKQFAGVDCFLDINSPNFQNNNDGIGCLSTRNLTPHATGLGNATDTQIKNAFQNGIRTDNKKIFPLMPWFIFHNMTEQDADSVVAFLRSLTPVDHQVLPNQVPFSLYNDDIDPTAGGFLPSPVLALTEADIPLPAGGANNPSAMNGRYLTSMAGLCIDCHTPEVLPFTVKLDLPDYAFAGGKLFPKEALGLGGINFPYPPFISTRNLTPHAHGLMGWTKAQIIAAIKDGKDRDGKAVCAATHGGLTSPYAALTREDLDDIAEYLTQLPAVANDTAGDPVGSHWANCGVPPIPAAVGAPETGTACLLVVDDDLDGTVNDGCFESGTDCDNAADDDGDTVPNDGCPVACGNCQGPVVP